MDGSSRDPPNRTVDETLDSTFADSPSVQVLGVNRNSVEDVAVHETNAASVSHVIATEVLTQQEHLTLPDDFVCDGCGNEKDKCHQKLFGQVLTHEVLSKYQEYMESGRGRDVDDDVVRTVFKMKYPVHLGAYVWLRHEMFDEKNDYELPICLREGALKSCCEMIKQRKIMDL